MSIIYINPFQFAAPPVGPTDPYFSNVSLLLHGDGTNGSTTIVDSSPSPKTVSAIGSASISTTQSKFGGSSINFNGGYLSSSNNIANFGGDPFTIEYWVNFNSIAAAQAPMISTYQGSGTGLAIQKVASQGGIGVNLSGDGLDIFASNVLSSTTWHHIALSGQSGANGIRLFIDGVQGGSTFTGATSFGSNTLSIGALLAIRFYGYIDALRITKGMARYTSNFTPPTAPFPDA